MPLLRYYQRLVGIAFTHSFGVAQDVVFGLLVSLGLIIYYYPSLATKMNLTSWLVAISGWKIAAIVLLLIVAARLLLSPYWLHQEQQRTLDLARAELSHLKDSRPRIRVGIEKWHTESSNRHTIRTNYGLCVHNDGGTARFQATIGLVKEIPSALQGGTGTCNARWGQSPHVKTEIMNGANDVFEIGFIDQAPSDGIPARIILMKYSESSGETDVFCDYLPLQQPPSDLFLRIEVVIVADPPMIDGPYRRQFQLGPDALTELAP